MQKRKIFYVIGSLFFILACETKADIRINNELSSLRVAVADSSTSIENLKDELLVLKGDIDSLKNSKNDNEEDNKEIEENFVKLEKEYELIKNNLEDLKDKFENEINIMKEDFNKSIEELKLTLLNFNKSSTKDDDISKMDIDTKYKKALQLYNKKQYTKALNIFKTMVGSKSKWYDERARFYNGNILYILKKYEEAIVVFHDFVLKYPKSIFISKALLAQADAFFILNMKSEAKSVFQEIVSKYPKSNEAKIAKEKLGKL